MKRILIAFLYIILITAYSLASDFELMPLGMNFNGSVTAGHHVIVYSDNGNYLITTDRGKSWKQYSIHPFGNIKQIENRGDTLWGIIEEGILIRSCNKGLNWELFPFQLDSGDCFRSMATGSVDIFIRCERKIMRINKDGNIIVSYKDDQLFCDRQDKWKKESFSYMGRSGDSLLVSVSNSPFDYNGKILIFSEELIPLDTIRLQEYFPPWLADTWDCRGFELKNIQKYKGRNVYLINYLPYYSNSDFSEWTYIYSDEKIGKTKEDSVIHEYLPMYHINNDFIYLPIIYHNINNNNAMMKHLKYQFKTSNAFCNFGLKEFDNSTMNFGVEGRLFENRYYTVGYSFIDALSESIWKGSFIVVEDTLFFWQGPKKTIVQSRNEGKDWELISHYQPVSPFFILNDTSFISLSNVYPNHIYSSFDGGQTFIPPLIDTSKYYPYFQVLNRPALLYIDSTGKGFFTAPHLGNNFVVGRSKNFAVTDDYGKSFRFFERRKDIFIRDMESSLSNVFRFGDKAFFAVNYSVDSSRIYSVDFSENDLPVYSMVTQRQKNIIHFFGNDLKNYFILARDADKKIFTVQETHDSGKTWNVFKNFGKDLNVKYVYEHSIDSIFISSIEPPAVYLYQKELNEIELLYQENTNHYSYFQLVCISNQFFIAGDSILMKNSDRNDLEKWEPCDWDFGKPEFKSFIFKGNIAFAYLSDSLRPPNYYRITLKDSSPVNVKHTSENTVKNFYASNPEPLPAKTFVNVKIFWDEIFDIRKTAIAIYNTMGVQVEKDENITILNGNERSAELVWGCTGKPSGIYLIVIDFNGYRRSVPVIVER